MFNPIDFPSLRKVIFNKKKRKEWLGLLEPKNEILHFPSLGYLPFQRFKLIEKANILLNCLFLRLFCMCKFGFKKPVFWVLNYDIAKVFNQFSWGKIKVYDRVDHPASIDEKYDIKIVEADRILLQTVDFVFVNSPYALRYVRKYNKKTFLVPCGCYIDYFLNKKTSQPEEIKRIKRPTIGMVGSIDHRLSYTLLYSLTKKRSDWNFVFVGGHFTDDWSQFELVNYFGWLVKLEKLPNVHFLEKKPKEMMPDYIASFDVCMIPYDTSQEFVKGCNPMKLYEYLAMGKPVVSTPIEAVNQYSPIVKIARNAVEFEKAIEESLKTRHNKNQIEKRKKIAQENSWEEKIERMWQAIL